MKKLLTLGVPLSLLGLSLNATTVAYYEFNGAGTATVGSTITDATGNHNGTVAGGDLLYGTDSLMGGYLRFAADAGTGNPGNRVEIPGAAELVFTTDQAYTIEAVFRTTQITTNGVIVSKGCDVSNPDTQWWLRHQGDGLLRGLIEGNNALEDSATSTATTVNDGQWRHVAVVFDGTGSPKRLEIYVDGSFSGLDTSVTTSGSCGGVDTDPVVIGEFASLAANRSFAGDIAAVRLSNTALTPAEFLADGFTFIVNITPTNGSSFLPASTVASFVVKSPTIGVASTNIHVVLNGADISSQLSFAGTDADRTVTLPALAANMMYQMQISVVDNAARHITRSVSFNTFVNDLFFIEGEDYNFTNGLFIDNPQLSSTPSPNNYLDCFGVEGVDYHQTNTPALALYRIGDQVGTAVSQDALRQAYLDAQATDPGVADYIARDHANTEWLNYTRTFPADTYRVYVRVAKTNTTPFIISLDQVTSGSTTPTQTTAPLGTFRGSAVGTATAYDFVPLKDPLGNEIAVALSGVTTLRLTMVSGGTGVFLNYLIFVPFSGVQVPFLTSVSPAPGAGNEPNNPPILISIRNADTQVNTNSIQLRLDGASLTPTVIPTSLGADVAYSPSLLATGWHTVTLIFNDSAATSVTNEWQFHVANLAVRGYWTFDEQAPGNSASTNAGAIQDVSGNTRHGTVSTPGVQYVAGSANHGNTSALKLTTGTDRVVVPDPAGNFNFASSFTMEAVVRTTNASTAQAILAKNGTGDGEAEYWWRGVGASGGVQRVGMSSVFLAGKKKINDGQWHHVAVVYDQAASEIRLYADYVFETNATLNATRPIGRPADLQIGGFIGTTTSEFDGDIDFIRISQGALTPAEFVQTSAAPQRVQLINVGQAGTTFTFGFVTLADRSYVVESAPAVAGATWTNVESVVGNGALKTLSYPNGGDRAFFRVRSQ